MRCKPTRVPTSGRRTCHPPPPSRRGQQDCRGREGGPGSAVLMASQESLGGWLAVSLNALKPIRPHYLLAWWRGSYSPTPRPTQGHYMLVMLHLGQTFKSVHPFILPGTQQLLICRPSTYSSEERLSKATSIPANQETKQEVPQASPTHERSSTRSLVLSPQSTV